MPLLDTTQEQRACEDDATDAPKSSIAPSTPDARGTPPQWELSPTSLPSAKRMEACRSRVLKAAKARRASGELRLPLLPEPRSHPVPNGYILEYVKAEPSAPQGLAQEAASSMPPTRSAEERRAAATQEGDARGEDSFAERDIPGKQADAYRAECRSATPRLPRPWTLSKNARLFLDLEGGVSVDVHLHLARSSGSEEQDEDILQSLLYGIQVMHMLVIPESICPCVHNRSWIGSGRRLPSQRRYGEDGADCLAGPACVTRLLTHSLLCHHRAVLPEIFENLL